MGGVLSHTDIPGSNAVSVQECIMMKTYIARAGGYGRISRYQEMLGSRAGAARSRGS